MDNTIMDAISYPKAIVLLLTSLVVLSWVSYFVISLKRSENQHSVSRYFFYVVYALGLFCWILSNAYFHTGFLVTLSPNVGVFMAIAANLSAFAAFAAAFIFSCKLRAYYTKTNTPIWQYVGLVSLTTYALAINIIPNQTIVDIEITSPSHFVLIFGPHTQGFFTSLLLLIVLTFINLLSIRRATSKVNQAKIIYMMIGIVVFMTSTAIIQLGMTYLLGDFSLTWLPPALSITEMLFVGYALLTSRFYSFKYLFYLFTTLAFVATSYSVLLMTILDPIFDAYQISVVMIMCVFIGTTWRFTVRHVRRFTAFLIYGQERSPVREILSLEKDFNVSIDEAIGRLAELLGIPQEKLQLVTNRYNDTFYDDYIKGRKSALVMDELEQHLDPSNQPMKQLYAKMRESNTALVLPLFDHSTSITHLLVSSHKSDKSLFSNEEISALQTLLARIQAPIEADRKVKQSQALANSIAHEMRNPLALVQLQFELLRNHVTQNATKSELLKAIEKGTFAVYRGRQLIDIILREVSDSSLKQEAASPSDIAYSIDNAIERYGYENDSVRNRIFVHNEGDFVANINETLFNFVIFNLLRNAIYYFDTYPESQIDIYIKKGRHENCIKVRDLGPGISASMIDKIFDDFFTHAKSGGSGLGLGYCQRVMQAFGGQISCQSVEGEFTEFTLSFPIVTEQTERKKEAEVKINQYASNASTPPRGLDYEVLLDHVTSPSAVTVLVVDDKEVQRALVKIYLEQLGVHVIQANNGETAVSVFQTNAVDLVLMDIQMPRMNGFEATKQIKAISPTVPVIALSGESSQRDILKIKNLMNGRLEKPTTKQALADVLQSHIPRSMHVIETATS